MIIMGYMAYTEDPFLVDIAKETIGIIRDEAVNSLRVTYYPSQIDANVRNLELEEAEELSGVLLRVSLAEPKKAFNTLFNPLSYINPWQKGGLISSIAKSAFDTSDFFIWSQRNIVHGPVLAKEQFGAVMKSSPLKVKVYEPEYEDEDGNPRFTRYGLREREVRAFLSSSGITVYLPSDYNRNASKQALQDIGLDLSDSEFDYQVFDLEEKAREIALQEALDDKSAFREEVTRQLEAASARVDMLESGQGRLEKAVVVSQYREAHDKRLEAEKALRNLQSAETRRHPPEALRDQLLGMRSRLAEANQEEQELLSRLEEQGISVDSIEEYPEAPSARLQEQLADINAQLVEEQENIRRVGDRLRSLVPEELSASEQGAVSARQRELTTAFNEQKERRIRASVGVAWQGYFDKAGTYSERGIARDVLYYDLMRASAQYEGALNESYQDFLGIQRKLREDSLRDLNEQLKDIDAAKNLVDQRLRAVEEIEQPIIETVREYRQQHREYLKARNEYSKFAKEWKETGWEKRRLEAEETVSRLEEERRRLALQMADQKKRIDSLQEKIASTEEEIAQQAARVLQVQKAHPQPHGRDKDIVDKAKGKLSLLEKSRDRLYQQVEGVNNRISVLVKKDGVLGERLESTHQLLESLSAEGIEYHRRLVKLNIARDELRRVDEEARRKLTELKESNREELAELRRSLAEAEQRYRRAVHNFDQSRGKGPKAERLLERRAYLEAITRDEDILKLNFSHEILDRLKSEDPSADGSLAKRFHAARRTFGRDSVSSTAPAEAKWAMANFNLLRRLDLKYATNDFLQLYGNFIDSGDLSSLSKTLIKRYWVLRLRLVEIAFDDRSSLLTRQIASWLSGRDLTGGGSTNLKTLLTYRLGKVRSYVANEVLSVKWAAALITGTKMRGDHWEQDLAKYLIDRGWGWLVLDKEKLRLANLQNYLKFWGELGGRFQKRVFGTFLKGYGTVRAAAIKTLSRTAAKVAVRVAKAGFKKLGAMLARWAAEGSATGGVGAIVDAAVTVVWETAKWVGGKVLSASKAVIITGEVEGNVGRVATVGCGCLTIALVLPPLILAIIAGASTVDFSGYAGGGPLNLGDPNYYDPATGAMCPVPTSAQVCEQVNGDDCSIPVLSWPVDSGLRSISSCFGCGLLGTATRFHAGIDLPNTTGTPITAPVGGTYGYYSPALGNHGCPVTHENYGNLVCISTTYNGNRVVYLYAHLDDFNWGLVEGNTISAGDNIGSLGNTGYSSGPHLHFEIRKYLVGIGTYVDPCGSQGAGGLSSCGGCDNDIWSY